MKHKVLLVSALVLATKVLFAQESEALSEIDSLKLKVEELKHEASGIKKMKISGYVQAQYQHADSAGIQSFSGGNFPGSSKADPVASDNRFMLRRARLKFTYSPNALTQALLQFDFTERGVGIRDAYLKVTEPFLKTFSIQAGAFNRPFGYEVGLSSGDRETPERGRMSQTIFPEERDLGVALVVEAPKTSPLSMFKLEAGLFNGTGIPRTQAPFNNTVGDIDSKKDFIGHLSFKKSILHETMKVSGGISYYAGGNAMPTKYLYQMGTDANGKAAFVVDSTSHTVGSVISKRNYFGADLQVSFETGYGISTFRGEYIGGTQLSNGSNTRSIDVYKTNDYYNPTLIFTARQGLYIRNFQGAYFYYIQDIFNSKNQFVFKYDVYDPNTKISGKEVASNGADIMYNTIGLGWIFRYDNNLKLMAYYDIVKNEETSVKGYSHDLKDNVFTLRLQYKF